MRSDQDDHYLWGGVRQGAVCVGGVCGWGWIRQGAVFGGGGGEGFLELG